MGDSLHSVEEVWEKWGNELLAYATVLVGPDQAEDVVADGLLKLMAASDERAVQPTLTLAYVRRTVLNEVRMRYRSMKRRERRELASLDRPKHSELLSDPSILAAVADLSVMQRAVIFLTYWEDLPANVVAEELSVGVGTVKRHLARARRNLRKVLQ